MKIYASHMYLTEKELEALYESPYIAFDGTTWYYLGLEIKLIPEKTYEQN